MLKPRISAKVANMMRLGWSGGYQGTTRRDLAGTEQGEGNGGSSEKKGAKTTTSVTTTGTQPNKNTHPRENDEGPIAKTTPLPAPTGAPRLTFAKKTQPPGRWLALYDGHCRICTGQAKNLKELAGGAGAGRLEIRSFQEKGALDDLPGLTWDACMQRMHVVSPEGDVYTGAEAIARAFSLRRGVGWVAFACYVPGLRSLADRAYQYVADNRYRLFGKTEASQECTDACAIHFGPKPPR